MRKRTYWRCVGWAVGVVVALVALGLALAYSGIPDVAATRRDPGPVQWLLSTTMDHSVQRHAAGIRVPALDDPAMVRTGFGHYREMCAACHGAPGLPIAEVGQGLNPRPPALVESAGDWAPNELFWITKNGVRMTGMPAWGVTHSDEKIWALVAFLRRLPKLTPTEYRKMEEEVPPLPMD